MEPWLQTNILGDHCLLSCYSFWTFVADIEAEVRAIQAKRQQVTADDESQTTNKVSLTGGVNYDTDIYGHKEGRYEGYVTSIAANEDLEVS